MSTKEKKLNELMKLQAYTELYTGARDVEVENQIQRLQAEMLEEAFELFPKWEGEE